MAVPAKYARNLATYQDQFPKEDLFEILEHIAGEHLEEFARVHCTVESAIGVVGDSNYLLEEFVAHPLEIAQFLAGDNSFSIEDVAYHLTHLDTDVASKLHKELGYWKEKGILHE